MTTIQSRIDLWNRVFLFRLFFSICSKSAAVKTDQKVSNIVQSKVLWKDTRWYIDSLQISAILFMKVNLVAKVILFTVNHVMKIIVWKTLLLNIQIFSNDYFHIDWFILVRFIFWCIKSYFKICLVNTVSCPLAFVLVTTKLWSRPKEESCTYYII